MRIIGGDQFAGRAGGCEVVDDGGQVIIGEPVGDRGQAEGVIDCRGPTTAASSTARAIFARIGAVPLPRPRPATGRRVVQARERFLGAAAGPGAA